MLILLFTFVGATISYADGKSSIFSVKGFGTFAVTGTDTNAIGFRRDGSTDHGATKSWSIPTDSRLGIQIDAKFNDTFSATTQWTLRDRTGNFFEQNLDMAFLRWNIQPDLYVRFGRVSTDSYMLSDHRNVGYAYPWMRPPHEFYGSIPIYHYDGVDITKKLEIDDGYLTLKVFGGYTFNQLVITNGFSYDQGASIFSGNAVYEKGNWRSRVAYSHLDITTEPQVLKQIRQITTDPTLGFIWPGLNSLTPQFKIIGKTLHYSELGVAYDDGVWLGQAEATYIDSDMPFFPTNASGYISLGRRLSSFTFYTLLGISKTVNTNIHIPNPLIPDPKLLALKNGLDQTLNSNGIDEKSISLGVRWDFYTNMALKAQWSHFWLGANGTQNWVENPAQQAPNQVNVFSVGLDFIF